MQSKLTSLSVGAGDETQPLRGRPGREADGAALIAETEPDCEAASTAAVICMKAKTAA